LHRGVCGESDVKEWASSIKMDAKLIPCDPDLADRLYEIHQGPITIGEMGTQEFYSDVLSWLNAGKEEIFS